MYCRTLNLKRLGFAVAILLALCVAPVRAGDLDDFNTAVEAAMSHHRVAAGYLRTGNVDLAVLELEAMRETWGIVSARPRPAALRDNALYTTAMLSIATRIVGIFIVLDMGRADVAIQSLDAIRNELSAMRRASGVTVLADCVLDSNTAMDALFAFDGKPLDATSRDVATQADAYRTILQRCDGMATERIRGGGEFRRLIDGALASLAQVPKAIETRDADLLHRLLIELRSFDNLLAFRFG
jgi:hypothetical protein